MKILCTFLFLLFAESNAAPSVIFYQRSMASDILKFENFVEKIGEMISEEETLLETEINENSNATISASNVASWKKCQAQMYAILQQQSYLHSDAKLINQRVNEKANDLLSQTLTNFIIHTVNKNAFRKRGKTIELYKIVDELRAFNLYAPNDQLVVKIADLFSNEIAQYSDGIEGTLRQQNTSNEKRIVKMENDCNKSDNERSHFSASMQPVLDKLRSKRKNPSSAGHQKYMERVKTMSIDRFSLLQGILLLQKVIVLLESVHKFKDKHKIYAKLIQVSQCYFLSIQQQIAIAKYFECEKSLYHKLKSLSAANSRQYSFAAIPDETKNNKVVGMSVAISNNKHISARSNQPELPSQKWWKNGAYLMQLVIESGTNNELVPLYSKAIPKKFSNNQRNAQIAQYLGHKILTDFIATTNTKETNATDESDVNKQLVANSEYKPHSDAESHQHRQKTEIDSQRKHSTEKMEENKQKQEKAMDIVIQSPPSQIPGNQKLENGKRSMIDQHWFWNRLSSIFPAQQQQTKPKPQQQQSSSNWNFASWYSVDTAAGGENGRQRDEDMHKKEMEPTSSTFDDCEQKIAGITLAPLILIATLIQCSH